MNKVVKLLKQKNVYYHIQPYYKKSVYCQQKDYNKIKTLFILHNIKFIEEPEFDTWFTVSGRIHVYCDINFEKSIWKR
jgi:hypothetical protein